MPNYGDLRYDRGWGECNKCVTFGRVGGDRNFRDTSHSYCRECRAQVQKTRYEGTSKQTRILQNLEAIRNQLTRLESSPDVVACLVLVAQTVGLVENKGPGISPQSVDLGEIKPKYETLMARMDACWKRDAYEAAWKLLDQLEQWYPERKAPSKDDINDQGWGYYENVPGFKRP